MFAPNTTHLAGDITATVNTIDTVTTVNTIDEVTNVTSVDAVDFVTAVGTCSNVTNVLGVSEVDNIVNVDRIQELPVETVELVRNNYVNRTPVTLYARGQTTVNGEFLVLANGDNTMREPLIPPATQCAISHLDDTDPLDTTTILKISYYADSVTAILSTQLATLNGVNKVTLTGNIYRIVNIEIDNSSPAVTSTNRVYLFNNALTPAGDGEPSEWYESFIIGPRTYPIYTNNSVNSRSNAVYYSPPSKTTIIKKMAFSCTNQANEVGVKIQIYDTNERYKTYDLYLGAGYTCCSDLYISIPPRSTMVVYFARLSGTDTFDVSCMIDMIQSS